MLTSADKNSAPVWDPVKNTAPRVRDTVAEPDYEAKPAHPIWGILQLIGIVGFLICLVVLLFLEEGSVAQAKGFGALAFSILLLCLPVIFRIKGSKHVENGAWALGQLAERHGYAFTALTPSKITSIQTKDGGYIGAKHDERVAPICDQVHPLLRRHRGNKMFSLFTHLISGETEKQVPFWHAIGLTETDFSLAAKELKTNHKGEQHHSGLTITSLVAYKLERDTKVNAFILGEDPDREDTRDMQTEYAQFNADFYIQFMDEEQSGFSRIEAEQALQSVLTPATQVTLVELRKHYRCQVAVLGDLILFTIFTTAPANEPEQLIQLVDELVSTFADAATSFKLYAE